MQLRISNVNLINQYREQLKDEEKAVKDNKDEVLNLYIENFKNLRMKYFSHLQPFQIDNYTYVDNEKNTLLNYNEVVKIKKRQLANLYSIKFILREDQLIHFIRHLETWKNNISAVYHNHLRGLNENSSTKTDKANKNHKGKNKEKKEKNEKKDENLNNTLMFNFDEIVMNAGNMNDIANIPTKVLIGERERLEKIYKSELPFNFKIYLIPGKGQNSLTKFISQKDIIYKKTIGDFYMGYDFKTSDINDKRISEIPLHLYLREAKHAFNLKVFKTKITSKQIDNPILDKLRTPYDSDCYLYGSVHIECKKEVNVYFDDMKEPFIYKNSKNGNIYIDIINIYNQAEDNKHKINSIEKEEKE